MIVGPEVSEEWRKEQGTNKDLSTRNYLLIRLRISNYVVIERRKCLFGRAAASPKTHSDSLLVLLKCVLKYLGPVLLTESRNLNRLLSMRIVKYEAMEAKNRNTH